MFSAAFADFHRTPRRHRVPPLPRFFCDADSLSGLYAYFRAAFDAAALRFRLIFAASRRASLRHCHFSHLLRQIFAIVIAAIIFFRLSHLRLILFYCRRLRHTADSAAIYATPSFLHYCLRRLILFIRCFALLFISAYYFAADFCCCYILVFIQILYRFIAAASTLYLLYTIVVFDFFISTIFLQPLSRAI